jgi:hypothetical protein
MLSLVRLVSRAAIVPALAALMATVAPPANVVSAARVTASCVHIDRDVAHYCGRASAHLSVFPEAVFRSGSCLRRKVDGVRLLQVRIGARTLDGSQTNNGLPYFSLGSAESPSGPKSANVIAFFRSRPWFGHVVWMKGDRDGGTFIAQGIGGSNGRASGRFSC